MARTVTAPPVISSVVVDAPSTTALTPDGRRATEIALFVPDVAAREILSLVEQQMTCAYEIGRRLLLADEAMGEDAARAWAASSFPFGERMARMYKRAATVLDGRPELREPLARAGITKMNKLLALPGDTLDSIASTGTIGELPLSQLSSVSVSELEKQLATEKKARAAAETAAAEAQAEAAQANRRLARAVSTEVQPLLATLATTRATLEAAFAGLGGVLDLMASQWGSLPPRARAEVMALASWTETMAIHEQLRLRALVGEGHYDDAMREVLLTRRPLDDLSDYRIPRHRVLPGVLDGEAD